MKISRNPVVIMIIMFITTIILVNIFIQEPALNTPQAMITYGNEINNYELVLKGMTKRLATDSTSIDFNHDWVIAKYNYEKHAPRRGPFGEDQSVVESYIMNAQFPGSALADLSAYCTGLYYSLFDDYDETFKYFLKIRNHNLKYFNNSLGICYEAIGKNKEAEKAYEQEINVKGDLPKAYSNLFNLLLRTKKYDKIEALLSKDGIYKYIDNEDISEYFFLTYNPIGYITTILKKIYIESNFYGLLAAFFILCIWIIYLRNVDVFEPEKWFNIFLVAAAGAVSALFAFPLYDFEALRFGFNLNGGAANDFLYSVFGIGAIEELVKILPVLLLLKFTRLIKEPIDYVIYACISALGFAFTENLLYLNSSHLYIIHGRAMLSALGHMFDSAIIGYGMAQQKLFHRTNKYLNFLLFYFLAALTHGVYDFILFRMNGSAVILFFILFVLFVAIMVSTFNNFINNTLNLSSFLKESDSINLSSLQDMLVCSLSAVVLYEYLVLSLKFGPDYSNYQLGSVMFTNIYFIVFLSSSLSSIDLNKGMWDNPIFPKFSRRPGLSYLINKKITIFPKPVFNVLTDILPIAGTVVKRISIGDQSDYLIVKLDVPLNIVKLTSHFNIPSPHPDYILIKGTDRKRTLTLGYKQAVYFVTVSAALNPFNEKLTKKDVNFIEYAFAG